MKRSALVLSLAFLLLSGCSRGRTVQRSETIMGTTITITAVGDTAEAGRAAIDAGMAELRRLDAMMSLYREDSELAKVNRAAGRSPVKVSPEMIEIVEAARSAAELSGGTFDPTIGPLVVLWQMRLKEGTVPGDEEIGGVKRLVDYRNIVIDRRASTLFLRKPGMILDLGGMKGYLADRIAGLFRQRGVTNALIALAGDIWALGRREDGTLWRIGVQHPRDKEQVLAVLELSDQYVSTSGDYERFVIREKKRYHHIIDPRTGRPSQGLISSTLVGTRGAVIDPLTKVPFILGAEEGMRLVKKLGAEAIFVDEEGTVTSTPGIKLLQP